VVARALARIPEQNLVQNFEQNPELVQAMPLCPRAPNKVKKLA
jgi:hypothetical protein